MGSRIKKKTVKTRSQAQSEAPAEPEKIGINEGKISVPSFQYKKAAEMLKRTYAARELDIPVRPDRTIRIYLDKDGTVTTLDGQEHELILAEFTIPHDEYEPTEKIVAGETVIEHIKKEVDFSKIQVKNFKIPDRS